MREKITLPLPSRICAIAGFGFAVLGSFILALLFGTGYSFGLFLHVLLAVLGGYMLAMKCAREDDDLFGMVSFLYLPRTVLIEHADAPRLEGPGGHARDDLKRINGIGPKLEETLNEMGVLRYEQIAGWTPEELARVDGRLGTFRGRAEREAWVDQARRLAAEKNDG